MIFHRRLFDLVQECDALPIEVHPNTLSLIIQPAVVRPMAPRSKIVVTGLWEPAPLRPPPHSK